MVELVRTPLHQNDAFLWILESDPHLRSTTLGIALLDCSPDWPAFVARTEFATQLIPMMRQRIAEPPTRLTPLVWADDPDFDLGFHLRRVQAPPPATLATVVELARTSAMAGFDRARPLWETTLVDGLEGGRAAIVTKLHHVLADGIGAMQLASLVFDLERHPPAPTREPGGAAAPDTDGRDRRPARVARPGDARSSSTSRAATRHRRSRHSSTPWPTRAARSATPSRRHDPSGTRSSRLPKRSRRP